MSEIVTIARPYAKAAFDFAVEQNNLNGWQQMLAFAVEVSSNQSVIDILSGSMASTAQAEIFINICGDQLDQYGQNLIKIMADNKRLMMLPNVLELFLQYKADKELTVEVNVTSALELDKDQTKQITAAMERRLSRKVKLNCKIDKSVIAGVIIQAGDMVIDGSVRSRLQRLADTLRS